MPQGSPNSHCPYMYPQSSRRPATLRPHLLLVAASTPPPAPIHPVSLYKDMKMGLLHE